jgi:DNA-binding transcriptional MerR regulator
MRIGELARTTGISADTIRYYEKRGLLPKAQRTASGYRAYPDGAANRIRVIRNAVGLGFPLNEIAKVLKVRDTGGAPCRQVRDYACELVKQMERRIEELTAERRSMLTMIREWDEKLAGTRPGGRANLLEVVSMPIRTIRPRESRLQRNR